MAAALAGALMMAGVAYAQPKLDLALCLDSPGSVGNINEALGWASCDWCGFLYSR